MFCASCGTTLQAGAAFCPSCGTPQPVAVPAAAYPVVFASGYASWGTRAIGFIVDSLLVGVVMCVLYFVLAGVVTSMSAFVGHGAAGGVCCMFVLLFPLATLLVGLYNGVYLISQRGYSIGQGLVNIKVVDAAGNLLTQGSAVIRLLVRAAMGFVPILPVLDLLWPLWDVRGQTLHDKAVNCYVVNNPGAA